MLEERNYVKINMINKVGSFYFQLEILFIKVKGDAAITSIYTSPPIKLNLLYLLFSSILTTPALPLKRNNKYNKIYKYFSEKSNYIFIYLFILLQFSNIDRDNFNFWNEKGLLSGNIIIKYFSVNFTLKSNKLKSLAISLMKCK